MSSYAVSIVVPIFKNEGHIDHLLERLAQISALISGEVQAIFVIDGSPDNSLQALKLRLPQTNFDAKIILLSRNFGAFSAIRNGLRESNSEVTVVMAADLQEPSSLIMTMLNIVLSDEADIAVGVRESRKDGFLSRAFSASFWRIFKRLSSLDLPRGGVDIFALNRSACKTLIEFKESSTSLIGLIYWMGFRRKEVPYVRGEREIGKSAWSLRKRINYAKDSITAFSELPLSIFLWSGVAGAVISLILAFALVIKLFFVQNDQINGQIIAIGILFVTSYLMAGLGLLGTYLWRVGDNVRNRPDSITWKSWEMPARKLTE